MATVAELCEVSELGEEARELLRDDLRPRAFLELLVEKQCYTDAVKFLAHALPKREAVWWAWVCARRAAGPDPPPKIKAALDATENWIRQPGDDLGREAMRLGEQAEFGTPAGCAAVAAFFSGTSLSPPTNPRVPPGEFMTAKAVSGAIILSAVAQEPEKASERYRASIAQGIEVAERIKLWDSQPRA